MMLKTPIPTLFIGASTDFLDGFIARNCNQETRVGAILDIVADKIFLLFLIIYLYLNTNISKYWFVLITIREMILIYSNLKIKSIFSGKLYVASHMILAPISIISNSFDIYMFVTALLAIFSTILYIL